MEGTGMSENGRKFKEAKGVVTRRAMETQLQKKLELTEDKMHREGTQGLK